jgi:hypothetical protein
MQNIKDDEQMEDFAVNTILIFNLHMTNKSVSNNYKSEGFGMQDLKMIYHRYWLNQQKYLPSH